MKITMVIPTYWGRRKSEGGRKSDAIYDHPTPLDENGTLGRLLESLSILDNKKFNLVILGVSTAEDIQEEVEKKVSKIIKSKSPCIQTQLFSVSNLKIIHNYLNGKNLDSFIPLLQLKGYPNVRNMCLFLPHLFDSEVVVLIDDDEVFEDSKFMNKVQEFIGEKRKNESILAVAGYYINPDNDFYLNKESHPWMTYWNKNDCMNRAFKKIIDKEPRLKETPFAFGGNLVIHRKLFTKVPFDPHITRGEDIDFLINSRMFGYKIYLDNQLSIKHLAPPKTHPAWCQMREDIMRFIFQRKKLDCQKPAPRMVKVKSEELDPYPGEFLKEDLKEHIFKSNQMLAIDYLSCGDEEGARECMNNISIAKTMAELQINPFKNLLILQKKWKDLMDLFSSEKTAKEVCDLLCIDRK